MSENVTTAPKKESKWTPEYTRQYHRERQRRLRGTQPDGYKRTNQDLREIYTEKGYEEHQKKVEQQRIKREQNKIKKVHLPCQVCGKMVYDSEGMRERHSKTIYHRTALEVLTNKGYLQN